MEVSRVGRRCLGQLLELHPITGEAPSPSVSPRRSCSLGHPPRSVSVFSQLSV